MLLLLLAQASAASSSGGGPWAHTLRPALSFSNASTVASGRKTLLSTRASTAEGVLSPAIGICWGLLMSSKLDPHVAVTGILLPNGIKSVKFYEAPEPELSALAGTGIEVQVMFTLAEMSNVAAGKTTADDWVANNVVRWMRQGVLITSVAVGNEPFASWYGTALRNDVLPALKDVISALSVHGLQSTVAVTCPLDLGSLLNTSYPPSSGQFADGVVDIVTSMLQLLHESGGHLTVNVFPYLVRATDPRHVALAYAALGNATSVTDGAFTYTNLLDAMLDAVIAAMEKVGYGHVPLKFGETGWPDSGGPDSSSVLATQYIRALSAQIDGSRGTPRRPSVAVTGYLFALFDEDEKPAAGIGTVENHWGLFHADGAPKYAGLGLVGSTPAEDAAVEVIGRTTGPSGGSSVGQWCVAKSGASDVALLRALNYACSAAGGGADCSPLQAGGRCFEPNTLQAHASYALNDYWQKARALGGTCDFDGTAKLISSNPSTTTCAYTTTTFTETGTGTGTRTGTGHGAGTGTVSNGTGAATTTTAKVSATSIPVETSAQLTSVHVTTPSSRQWCVAKSGLTVEKLQVGIAYACAAAPSDGGADCTPLQGSGACFGLKTLELRTSYAYNDYWQRRRSIGGTCDFGGTAELTGTDPSTPTCRFASSPSTASNRWCVAKDGIAPSELQAAMSYACDATGGGADCGLVQPGGACFEPNTVKAHASYAFNEYWQRNRERGVSCDFGQTAMLTSTDPSTPSCVYASGQ